MLELLVGIMKKLKGGENQMEISVNENNIDQALRILKKKMHQMYLNQQEFKVEQN